MITWDPRVARYRNSRTGRFVSAATVRQHAQDSIAAAFDRAAALREDLVSGSLSLESWRTQIRAQLKNEYIRQGVTGRGGIEAMTSVSWGSVGGSLSEQYSYLDAWFDELSVNGIDSMTDSAFNARVNMYLNSSREAFGKGQYLGAVEAGLKLERWVLGTAEHCDDCVGLASLGWVPIGSIAEFPGSGQTICLTNCHCHKEFK